MKITDPSSEVPRWEMARTNTIVPASGRYRVSSVQVETGGEVTHIYSNATFA